MRDKLAKTKIASESMGVIQNSLAVNQTKNFAKKKNTDTESLASSQASSVVIMGGGANSSIYKPNLKRKQSTTGAAASTNTKITTQTKISSNLVSGTVTTAPKQH